MTKPKVKSLNLPQTSPQAPSHPKRGHYQQKECPYCHVMVGNLGNHVKLKHPTESSPPAEMTKESLLGKKPATPPPKETKYYCQNCRAVLRKGEEACWQCGTILNWKGII